MIYKYRLLSTSSSTRDDETPEQIGEKLQSTSSEKQLKRKKENSDSSDE